MDEFMRYMKNIVKTILKLKIVIILVLFILFFAILLPAFVFLITIGDGTYREGDWKSAPYAASTYTNNANISNKGITTDVTAQELWNKMIEEGCEVEKYLNSPEELEKLMNAEIVTQYPKMGTTSGELDGVIQFERNKTDGTSIMLQYIDINTFNSYISKKDTVVLNYFTLDSDGNLLIAVQDEKTEELSSNDSDVVLSDYTSNLDFSNSNGSGGYSKTEYNLDTKVIDYKRIVSKYTMPFQYLWSLIVIGDDKELALELADLVEDSEITISIYDNITTTVNESTYTYTKEEKINVSATATAYYGSKYYTQDGSWNPADEWDEGNYTVSHKITDKSNTLIVDITKANVWIVDYSKNYTYKSAQQVNINTNERDISDTQYVDIGTNPKVSSNGSDLPEYNRFKEKLSEIENKARASAENVRQADINSNINKGNIIRNNSVSSSNTVSNNNISSSNTHNIQNISSEITSCQASYYIRVKNKHEVNTVTETTQEYVAGNIINNPKVEKNVGVNFVTILSKNSHTEARTRICDEIPGWLFELLETNPDTVNMVDITKYLLNKVVGKEKFGNINIDFDSLYGTSDFFGMSSISGDIDVSDEKLFIKDVEILKKAFTGYSNSGKLVQYAEEFIDMQNKYKVNALFAAAVSITETGAGNAGNAIKTATATNSVGVQIGQCWNNWFNVKTSSNIYGIVYNGEGESHYRIYNTVGDSIDGFGWQIADGTYYYQQNKFTVDAIGHIYCPNSSAYPTQGDDWVQHTLTYIYNFYSAAGIDISTSSGGSSNQMTGSVGSKLRALFPTGIPTTKEQCEKYIATISVPLTTKDGEKTAGNLSIHKDLASDVQKVFEIAQKNGFKIYQAGGYSYRVMNNGGSGNLSHHSYGVAIDINVNENYSHRGSTIYAGSFWNPLKSEFSIPRDGILVKAFESIGWSWGGNWSGNYQDYMHFSYTGQ